MNKIYKTRRLFLAQFAAAGIYTAACPHLLLGMIEPVFQKRDKGICGLYKIAFSKFPVLRDIWGSVRMRVPNIDIYFPPIIITHVPKEVFGVDFACISEICPHKGMPVLDLNPEDHFFECMGEGSLFEADGTYAGGPAAADLVKYQVTYDGGDGVIVEIPGLIDGISEAESDVCFLSENIPNPCSKNTAVHFSTPYPAWVSLDILTAGGDFAVNIFSEKWGGGVRTVNINTAGMASGTYFFSLKVNGSRLPLRKMMIIH